MQISKMRDFQAERGGRGDLVIKKEANVASFLLKEATTTLLIF
ncbi:hypothetical protein [Psychromonas sp. CNPT3]|nr:hypothetical protein [Psychromonas sp. CNPT3]